MLSRKQLAALALLALCAVAAGRELQAKKNTVTPYAANLYEAVTKAQLFTLKAAIDAAGLTVAFQNPNLGVTLFAPTEAAWQRFYRDCAKLPKKEADVAKYCSFDKLKAAKKAELQQFVQYMVLYGSANVQAGNDWWPIGRQFVKKPSLLPSVPSLPRSCGTWPLTMRRMALAATRTSPSPTWVPASL